MKTRMFWGGWYAVWWLWFSSGAAGTAELECAHRQLSISQAAFDSSLSSPNFKLIFNTDTTALKAFEGPSPCRCNIHMFEKRGVAVFIHVLAGSFAPCMIFDKEFRKGHRPIGWRTGLSHREPDSDCHADATLRLPWDIRREYKPRRSSLLAQAANKLFSHSRCGFPSDNPEASNRCFAFPARIVTSARTKRRTKRLNSIHPSRKSKCHQALGRILALPFPPSIRSYELCCQRRTSWVLVLDI
jgi:hypothetical protein